MLIFFITQAFVQDSEIIKKELTLSGKVLDAYTGKALANAQVKLVEHNKTDKTNSKGEFKFNGLKSMVYTVKVSHHGYKDYKKDMHVKEKDKQVTIQLKPSKAGSP